jgi:hypothetical protein
MQQKQDLMRELENNIIENKQNLQTKKYLEDISDQKTQDNTSSNYNSSKGDIKRSRDVQDYCDAMMAEL